MAALLVKVHQVMPDHDQTVTMSLALQLNFAILPAGPFFERCCRHTHDTGLLRGNAEKSSKTSSTTPDHGMA